MPSTTGRSRSTSPPPTAASGCTWWTTAGPWKPCSSGAGWARPTTWAAGWRRASSRSPTLCLDTLEKPRTLKKIVPDRPGHDRRYLLDCTKISKELGWAPTIAFEEGLADTVRWYAANRSWWEPLLDRAPVVESSWGEGSPGDRHRPLRGSRHASGCSSPAPGASSGATWSTRSRVVSPRRAGLTIRTPGDWGAHRSVTCRRRPRPPGRGRPRVVLAAVEGVRPHVIVHAGAWTAVDACEGGS